MTKTLLTMLCWFRLLLPAVSLLLALHWVSAQADECSERCDLYHGHCDQDRMCRCDPGWDGEFCEDCVRMPGCAHGSCHQPWQCMCHNGWAGKFCDKDLHLCNHSDPCQNQGECLIDHDGEFSCICPEPFYGRTCELKRGPCEKAGFPCLNGGSCHDRSGFANTFTCRCLAGYTGELCQMDVDDCLMRPCANGATCHDGINRFSCECPSGFQGRFCTINIDDCAGQPCQNNGRCYDRVGDYECYCPEGFMGKSCEIPIPKPTWDEELRASTKDSETAHERSRVTRPPLVRTLDTGRKSQGTISVKEVVMQVERSLTTLQLVLVIVFGTITGIAIFSTITVVLVYRNRSARQTAHHGYGLSAAKTQYQECQGSSPDHRKTTEL
uniref:Protein delta homolog 2 n=1 Tax=Xenopus tropicalis TaxID=8364 RepID=A0A803JYD3_XENTR